MAQAKPEQDISNAIRLAVGSLPDVRIWRNNVGQIKDARGIPVSYGLAIGSADLIGLVGPYGRFLSIEVKRPGYKPSGAAQLKHEAQQQAWRDIINAQGGVAGRVDCVEQALELVEKARRLVLGRNEQP